MGIHRVSGSGSEMWKRKAWPTAQAGSSHPGQRHLLCGSLWLCWRLLPRDFGPWQTVYGYYRRWTQDWTWRFIHDTLRDCLRKTEGRKVATTAAIIDSQSVKIADQAGERGYDAAKKVSGRKRHLAVDCLGLILALFVTPAGMQDRDAAKSLIKVLVGMFGRLQVIWADG